MAKGKNTTNQDQAPAQTPDLQISAKNFALAMVSGQSQHTVYDVATCDHIVSNAWAMAHAFSATIEPAE